jgi:predicted acyltransferase
MESKRLLSLDVFRGLTIAAMILVNNPATWSHIYAPLRHAEWNGITPTDLIFPFFLFIVGVSIALAYTKLLTLGQPLAKVYRKLVFRALKIFAVGILLHLIPDFNFAELRYAGVLQRIALVFLVCGFLFLKTTPKTQIITGAVILIAYWLAMSFIPTPGYPAAMLEPGCNLAAWADSRWLPGKLWNQTWDPEGLISTLPAMVTTISGMLTGTFILGKKNWEQKVVYLMISGFLLTIAGSVWGWFFPINKNLWTSSYVLLTSGLAAMTLGTLIYIVDVIKLHRWFKFGIVYGSNAIAIYVLASVLGLVFYNINIGNTSLNMHFFNTLTQIGISANMASLLYALLYVALNYVPAYLLYKYKIFIKL